MSHNLVLIGNSFIFFCKRNAQATFVKKPHLKNFCLNLIHSWSNEVDKGTGVSQALPSLHVKLLDIMLTVPSNVFVYFRFKIKENHLFGDSLRLKCTVEILDVYWMSSEEEAKILQSPGFSLPAFSKPMFSSDSRDISSQLSSILISLRLVSILLSL